MWQNLDMNELAKPVSSFSGEGQVTAFSKQLRDFSTRLVPDDKLEILHLSEEQATDQATDEEPATDMALSEAEEQAGEQETISTASPQMLPFSIEEPDKNNKTLADIDCVRAQAFAAGKEEGQKSAREEYDAERHRLVENHAQELAQTRQNTINEVAGDLLATCQAAFATLQQALEHDLAQIIAPLIGEKLTAQAIAEFTRQLTNEAIEASLPLIIEGSPALLDAFIEHANSCPTIDLTHYQLRSCEETSLRLIHGDRVLSTRLSPLLQQLREII